MSSSSSQMVKLWIDHVYLTRLFIEESATKYPGLSETTNRLLQNQRDLGENLSRKLGRRAGEEYTKLLTDHILIAKAIVDKSIAGMNVTTDVEKWKVNGRDISRFLSRVGANISYETIYHHFLDHLNITLKEATAIITKKYSQVNLLTDAAVSGAIVMARYIADNLSSHSRKKSHK